MEKMRQLSISLTPQQYRLVAGWADQEQRTVAQVIRGLVMREAARLATSPMRPAVARDIPELDTWVLEEER